MCHICIVSTRRYCERCGRLVPKRRSGVDKDLIEYQASVARQNKRIASSRKCRECGKKVLGLARYFTCEVCLPTPQSTSDDSFVFPAAPGMGLWTVNNVD